MESYVQQKYCPNKFSYLKFCFIVYIYYTHFPTHVGRIVNSEFGSILEKNGDSGWFSENNNFLFG